MTPGVGGWPTAVGAEVHRVPHRAPPLRVDFESTWIVRASPSPANQAVVIDLLEVYARARAERIVEAAA